jgi:hypothetical protein
MEADKQTFESWCIVELFGHQRMAGFVTEASIGGGSFIRIDVPETAGDKAFTRYLGPSAIYAMNPCDEDTARQAAAAFRPRPIQRWELPQISDQEPIIAGKLPGETERAMDEAGW